LGEKVIFDPNLIDEAEAIVHRIQENLKAARSRQEKLCKQKTLTLGVQRWKSRLPTVSPMKGVKRFMVKEKLAPRYIGPFPILEKCGPVAYKLELPPTMARVHNIFHMSQLKKCLKAPVDVVLP
jgi:DNA polymerase elongation subunit (family B)